MKKHTIVSLLAMCIALLAITGLINQTAISVSMGTPLSAETCIIIDAGHGYPDGGAVSYSGKNEADINLEIAIRLSELFHLLGIKTVMIRKTVESIYTTGNTIAEQKISDIKERVRIANLNNADLFISIHQNHYIDNRCSGTQIFYGNHEGSKPFGNHLQKYITSKLQPDNKRTIKSANDIYLMRHIRTRGILIECGFLSNPEEEAKLCSAVYQKAIACTIATGTYQYLHGAFA